MASNGHVKWHTRFYKYHNNRKKSAADEGERNRGRDNIEKYL